MKVQSPLHGAPLWVVGVSSGAPRCRLGDKWPDSVLRGRATRWTGTADGPSRRTLRPWLDEGTKGPTSSGRRAEGARDASPGREPRERGRHVQDDPPDRALDPHGELEQPLAQGGDLRIGTRRARRPAPQFLEQDVRRQREQDPELV